MSEAIWECPPEFADDRCAWRAGIDCEAADQAGKHAAGANPGKILADVVGLPFVRRERAGHCCRLHDANHGNHERERHQPTQFLDPGEGRQGQSGHAHRKWAEHADAVAIEMKQRYGEPRPKEADQRTRNPRADLRRAYRHGQNTDADRKRPDIGVSDPAEDVDEANEQMPHLPGDAHKGGQLADDDVDRDAGEEARGDRNRKQGGEPTGPEQTNGEENDANHEGQQRRQLRVVCCADNGDRG